MNATLAQAKRDYALGILRGVTFVKAITHDKELSDDWTVCLHGDGVVYSLVDHRTKQPRRFKTIGAAVSAAEAIGFSIEFLSTLGGDSGTRAD
jgi:hypothetical protein